LKCSRALSSRFRGWGDEIFGTLYRFAIGKSPRPAKRRGHFNITVSSTEMYEVSEAARSTAFPDGEVLAEYTAEMGARLSSSNARASPL
jgi:hypothetical protein